MHSRQHNFPKQFCTAQNFTTLHNTALFFITLQSIESVPRQEEGSTGKYQHEVEGVPKGATRGNYRDQMLVFPVLPYLSQGTDIIQGPPAQC